MGQRSQIEKVIFEKRYEILKHPVYVLKGEAHDDKIMNMFQF